MFPRRILLLALTTALAPIAVALVVFPTTPNGGCAGSGIPGGSTTWALAPMAVLPLPVFEESALYPMAVLSLPVRLKESALYPMAVLLFPVLLKISAKSPLAVLPLPVVLLPSASTPLAVL